jgi:hypothetical protein
VIIAVEQRLDLSLDPAADGAVTAHPATDEREHRIHASRSTIGPIVTPSCSLVVQALTSSISISPTSMLT